MLASNHNWKILTSGPKCNSFFNSKGLSSYIPDLYKYNLHLLIDKSRITKNNIQAYEYASDNETFHGKGSIIA